MKKILYHLVVFILSFVIVGCSNNKQSQKEESPYAGFEYDRESDEDYVIKIPYTDMGNNLVSLPVTINGMGVEMIFDTGASSTTISLQEAQYLAKHGKLEEDDILGVQKFGTADGKTSEGLIIKLKELVIGNKITVSNTYATVVMNQEAPLLLGGSVFTQFREVSVDREEHIVKFYKY
ncbi:MAG: retroviral-like aspartic protease family protein [Bacteroidales bacterium]|nr:retroviral-like aspartic protease family protein [Bacteroidales bacterium]